MNAGNFAGDVENLAGERQKPLREVPEKLEGEVINLERDTEKLAKRISSSRDLDNTFVQTACRNSAQYTLRFTSLFPKRLGTPPTTMGEDVLPTRRKHRPGGTSKLLVAAPVYARKRQTRLLHKVKNILRKEEGVGGRGRCS
jgi:hypothetical protein